MTTIRAPASRSAVRVGRTARIRPSSLMTPGCSLSKGTFRSARTSTRRPTTPSASRSSRGLILTGSTSRSRLHQRSQARTDQLDEVDQTVGVAPLVVVPADDLDLVLDDLRQTRVEDARRRVGDDVRRHDL